MPTKFHCNPSKTVEEVCSIKFLKHTNQPLTDKYIYPSKFFFYKNSSQASVVCDCLFFLQCISIAQITETSTIHLRVQSKWKVTAVGDTWYKCELQVPFCHLKRWQHRNIALVLLSNGIRMTSRDCSGPNLIPGTKRVQTALKKKAYQICSHTVAALNSVKCPAPFPVRARVCITDITSWKPPHSTPTEDRRVWARGNMDDSIAWGTDSPMGLLGFTRWMTKACRSWRFSLNCSSSISCKQIFSWTFTIHFTLTVLAFLIVWDYVIELPRLKILSMLDPGPMFTDVLV